MSSVFCVIAVPEVGVSTPQAFRHWDALVGGTPGAEAPSSRGEPYGTTEAVSLMEQDQGDTEGREVSCEPTLAASGVEDGAPESVGESGSVYPTLRGAKDGAPGHLLTAVPGSLTDLNNPDRLKELSLAFASLYAEPGTSGIIRGSNPAGQKTADKQGGSEQAQGGQVDDLAENTLLALVRTGVENDFERVVFPAYPSLREIKRQLMGTGSGAALYAALSGSGSALFGLYRSERDARAAQHRVQEAGTKALITKTLPRSEYWTRMFAG
ncbi:MAG: hypothetical protein JSS95_11230 [Acidobacteria bacterium]|nr:hypothetical protein [Acidobacteriota bacterium]